MVTERFDLSEVRPFQAYSKIPSGCIYMSTHEESATLQSFFTCYDIGFPSAQ
jgi:hypothetical protein